MNESFEINEEFERLAGLALPQLLAIDPEIFGQLVEYELEKFRNFSTVFHRIANKKRILRNMVDEINKPKKTNIEANEWLGDMLGNINNLIAYLQDYPYKEKINNWNSEKRVHEVIAIALENKLKEMTQLKKWNFSGSQENYMKI